MTRNKLTVIFGFALFSILTCQAERVPLWPEGKIPNFQPQQIAATTKEVKQAGFKREEYTMPYLIGSMHRPKKMVPVCCSFQAVVTITAVIGGG